MPLLPPPQPTQAPEWFDTTGRNAVTRPPGDSSQPSSPCWTGSRLATATTGRSSVAMDADSLIAVTVSCPATLPPGPPAPPPPGAQARGNAHATGPGYARTHDV